MLEFFGDYLESPVFTGRPRYEGRKAVVERINKQQGGKATLVRLPDVGLNGNSHMMMLDGNNLQVADLCFLGSRTTSSDARPRRRPPRGPHTCSRRARCSLAAQRHAVIR